jgi:DNA mismatch endonuclease, patch repair protein
MRANRARDTGPERRLRQALRAAGLGGYRLNWRNAPGRPDIAYPGRKLAIFVHGCYWHHCPRCYPNLPKSNPEFWARKFALNRERDARKRYGLESVGWTVLEVWEHQLVLDPGIVVEEVAALGTWVDRIGHSRASPAARASKIASRPALGFKADQEERHR